MHDSLLAGSYEIGVAGGMESMSNAPYLLPKARGGYRLGHGQVLDHMFFDGLEDAYQKGPPDGHLRRGVRRELRLHARGAGRIRHPLDHARAAGDQGWLLRLGDRAGDRRRQEGRRGRRQDDEQPPKAQIDKIPNLKPAFKKDGTVTPANSSSISDGAAAVVLMRESKAKALGLTPLARIVGHTTHAQEPNLFTTAPVVRHAEAVRQDRLDRRRASISTRSTKPSPSSPWPPCTTSSCRPRR